MPTTSETSALYKLCRFDFLDQGVVEAVFVSSSIAAIDQFYAQLEPLMERAQATQPLLLLVNTTKAPTLPVIYAIQQARAAAGRHPGHSFSKSAIIIKIENRLLMIEIDHLSRTFQWNNRRLAIFGEHQRADAINWLLAPS